MSLVTCERSCYNKYYSKRFALIVSWGRDFRWVERNSSLRFSVLPPAGGSWAHAHLTQVNRPRLHGRTSGLRRCCCSTNYCLSTERTERRPSARLSGQTDGVHRFHVEMNTLIFLQESWDWQLLYVHVDMYSITTCRSSSYTTASEPII